MGRSGGGAWAAVARRDLSSRKHLLYGGCAAAPGRVAETVERVGPVLVQVHAQTESGLVTALAAEDHDPGRPELMRSVGKPVPGVRVAVRDTCGQDLPPGAVGEVYVRSDLVMRGYWKRPELTRDAINEGWLSTRVLGRLDEAGYLTVLGRAEEVINKAAGRIHPSEIEDLINSLSDIADCAAFGVNRFDRTEDIQAVVVPVPVQGMVIDEQRILEFVRTKMGARYEPSVLTVVPEITLTGAGKPDRKLLRLRAATVETVRL